MASASGEQCSETSSTRLCAKSRKCSKKYNHSGRCDSNRTVTNRFWVNSRSQVLNKLKRDFREKAEKKEEVIAEKFARINEKEEDLKVKEEDLKEKEEDLNDKEREATEKLSRMETSSEEIAQKLEETKGQQEQLTKEMEEKQKALDEINRKYEKLKVLLEQRGYARTRRQNVETTFGMINNRTSTTRFRRKLETKNILQFIHGGEEGSLYGAWDYLRSHASSELMDKLISGYKRGKYLQGVFGRATDNFNKSEDALKQAVAMKYHNHLSRRKFDLVCKTQSSVFDPKQETWLPRCIKHKDVVISLPKIVSDAKASRGAIIDPKQLSVKDLKKELAQRGLLVTGSKDILIKRLETALNKEL